MIRKKAEPHYYVQIVLCVFRSILASMDINPCKQIILPDLFLRFQL